MKFCPQCGSADVEFRVPAGDNRPRHICSRCNYIHYVNPKLVVGCVPVWKQQVLLCRRAIEPRLGYWTTPAGFMEIGETLEQAAARETLEEACAEVEIEDMFAVVDVVRAEQVHVMFRAHLVSGEFAAGEESLEVALFDEADVPWPEIAFPSIRFSLQRFFADRTEGQRRLHITESARVPRE